MQNHIDKASIIDQEPDLRQIMHDVRIQMHTIASAMQVMGRYTENRALLASGIDVTYFHEIIGEAVQKGVSLLNTALPVRGANAREESFCAVAVARGIVKGLSVLAENMDYSLIYKGPEKCPLPGNKSKFERILYNLVTNAICHTPGGTTVQIEIEKRDGILRATVTDCGGGLSKEQTDVLCAPLPFPENTEGYYGLRNIRELTDALYGEIDVETDTENNQNSISVLIPCAESLAQFQKIRHNIV